MTNTNDIVEALVEMKVITKIYPRHQKAAGDALDLIEQQQTDISQHQENWRILTQTNNQLFDELQKALQRIPELEAARDKWMDDCIILQGTFRHTHNAIGNEKGDDSCAECGLDLRHPVHLRALEDKE